MHEAHLLAHSRCTKYANHLLTPLLWLGLGNSFAENMSPYKGFCHDILLHAARFNDILLLPIWFSDNDF